MAKGDRDLNRKPRLSNRRKSVKVRMQRLMQCKNKTENRDEFGSSKENFTSVAEAQRFEREESPPLMEHSLCQPDEFNECQNDINHSDQEMTGFARNENIPLHLSGRRLIDIDTFLSGLKNFKHLEIFSCSFHDIEFISEQKNGFQSKFILKCKVCMETNTIQSDNNEGMDVNEAMVLGIISTGNGFAQLEEISAFCNVPCMSEHTFTNIQTKLAPRIADAALKSMEEAAEEEKNLAIEAGDIDVDGIPYITVIADGAWCKRSYKVNYDASSGVGVIIGKRTGKVLFLGIRNKYCCICSRASGKNPPEHVCFKNWTKTSTAMESDIIAEGFRQSVSMHGLKYLFLIGDGDSSIMRKLLDCRPYNTKPVSKIECKNHLLRNYCTRLRDLTKKCISSKKQAVHIKQRNNLNNNIRRLRNAIQCAAQFRLQEENNHQEKIKKLITDIYNSINHVFGDHTICEEYYCKKKSDKNLTEYNWVPEMKESGLYQDIVFYLNRLARNAGSLILNMDNNCAESYNSVVAKFVGGKRVNFSSRASYQTRCQAAAISYNIHSSQYPCHIYKSLSNRSPGKYTKKYVQKKEMRKKWVDRRKKTNPEKFKKKKKFTPADKDYGAVIPTENTEEIVDYSLKEKIFLESLKLSVTEIKNLEQDTVFQADDPTGRWKEERSKRLTASWFGKICKMKNNTHCANTVKTMLYTHFDGNAHTRWGKENENIARVKLAEILKKEIRNCGLFVDEFHPFLAASPDGLLDEDGIIEIKCPSTSRLLEPIEGIKQKKNNFCEIKENKIHLKRTHEYYYQVQGQLHITKKTFCVFAIWTSKGIEFEKIYKDETFWEEKMKEKLEEFYFKCLLPELINPQYTKGLPIQDLRK